MLWSQQRRHLRATSARRNHWPQQCLGDIVLAGVPIRTYLLTQVCLYVDVCNCACLVFLHWFSPRCCYFFCFFFCFRRKNTAFRRDSINLVSNCYSCRCTCGLHGHTRKFSDEGMKEDIYAYVLYVIHVEWCSVGKICISTKTEYI